MLGIAGLALWGCAPLAAPAVFAWSFGAIFVLQVWRLATGQAGPARVLAEGAAALALAFFVFALSTNFEFREFLTQFFYHASRSTGGGSTWKLSSALSPLPPLPGCCFGGTGLRPPLCHAACGQFLAAFLHDKALIRNLAASMVFLIALETLLPVRWMVAKAGLAAILFLLLAANFFSFYLFSGDNGSADLVRAAYARDLQQGRRVFVDEVMAQHFLDQNTGGALSWTWGGSFPKARPTSLEDLAPGDVWYVSEYTLQGYLKGRHAVARAVLGDESYRRVPQLPCLLGRHSCNLPESRWTMLRLERTAHGVLSVRAIGMEERSRRLER